MGMAAASLKNVAQFIALAVAPIFLLSAVATTLMVFATRLSRIVDRGRSLEERTAPDERVHAELLVLEKRAQLIYTALSLGVTAAIAVVLLMALAFAGEMFTFNAASGVALLFMGALVAYACALMCLLREVFLAIGNFRLGIHTASPS